MTKLLKLKDWVTVPDAARHLSLFSGEEISEADLLQFALAGHLILSVRFLTATIARRGRIVDATAELDAWMGAEVSLDGNTAVSFDKEDVTFPSGVWDLAMVGVEQQDVERRYQLLTGGSPLEPGNRRGPILKHPDGTWAQIVDHDLRPVESLPPESMLVVRTSALRELEERIIEPETTSQRPLGRRERDSLLVIIAALAELNGIDVKRPSKAAMEIESATIRMGARVAARTIEDHLKHIREALERKGAED